MVKLIIKWRSRFNDYHVALNGNDAVWDCGKSPHGAVKEWVRTHGKNHGIDPENCISPAIFPDVDRKIMIAFIG